MSKYINQLSFKGIANVAVHCDLNKLDIAINEAEIFDLQNYFCDSWAEIITVWDEVKDDSEDALKINLIKGGSYLNCSDKTMHHVGIEKVWCYFAYSRYLMLNHYNDTPSGSVEKKNDFSIPISIKEVQPFSNKYRDMGLASMERVKDFICRNNDTFNFDLECGDCKCVKCTGEAQALGWGFKSKTIKKKLR